jgi:hypothetical protein
MGTHQGHFSGFRTPIPKLPNSWLNLLLCLPLLALFTAGCLPSTPPFFSPASGTFNDPINVTLNLPAGTSQVFYTLDGTEPAENCLQYTGGSIEISQTTVLKVKYWLGPEEQPLQEASYTIINGTGGGGGPYVNEDMVEAWSETELNAERIVAEEYNGGCTFVVEVPDGAGGCKKASGFGDLGKLDHWYFHCDNGASTPAIKGNANAVPATPAACGTDGFVVMGLFTEGLGGRTDFIYEDHDLTLSGGGNLQVNGHTVGHFNMEQNGTIGTEEGSQAVLSGAFNGTIDASVIVTNKQGSGGFYVTNCTDPGCGAGPKTYLISPGPVYTLFEPSGEASCKQPSFLLHNSSNGNCVTAAPGANFNLINTFCANTPNQQWDIKPVESTSDANDFTIELADGSGCLQPAEQPPFFLWRNTEFAPCVFNDPLQVWTMTYMGNGQTRIESPNNTYTNPAGLYCMTTFNDLNDEFPEVLQLSCNENKPWNRWEILPDGRFPPINPVTHF